MKIAPDYLDDIEMGYWWQSPTNLYTTKDINYSISLPYKLVGLMATMLPETKNEDILLTIRAVLDMGLII